MGNQEFSAAWRVIAFEVPKWVRLTTRWSGLQPQRGFVYDVAMLRRSLVLAAQAQAARSR
jgi:hypothetical protein